MPGNHVRPENRHKMGGATKWKKGQAGNPGGKNHKMLEETQQVTALARTHSKRAVEALAAIVEDAFAVVDEHGNVIKKPFEHCSASSVATAASAILDRGFGKPKEHVSVEATGQVLVVEIPLELKERIAEVCKRPSAEIEAKVIN